MKLTHRTIQTDGAPAAIGPYSQAVVVPEVGLVFTSGQLGLDPATGELVPGGIEPEFRRVLDNLGAILEAAGSGLDRIVRATLYMVDLSEFGTVNAIYAERIGSPLPARVTVGASSLPKGARIEVDLIASVRAG
jgi:2-iminobutanoate/2-iminopropanoate deaminase